MDGTRASFGFRDVDAGEKAGLVRGVFDRVASRYDLMNDLMSGGVHRLWKDATAARLNPQPGEKIVDCAGGTGDIARRLVKLARGAKARRGGADATVHVIDYNAEMIAAGRDRGGEPEIDWTVGDAQALPLPDACADAYVIAFGIRNVTDIGKALAEARRLRRLQLQRHSGDRRGGGQGRRQLPLPCGVDPPLPRPAHLRPHDRRGGLFEGRLDGLHGRGRCAAHRLGALTWA